MFGIRNGFNGLVTGDLKELGPTVCFLFFSFSSMLSSGFFLPFFLLFFFCLIFIFFLGCLWIKWQSWGLVGN